jgi:protein-L-isoaspartate(D-aspartate) O-methyltransferase
MDIAAPTDPFADARNRMVDSQVRPNRVTDPRIIAAMRAIPRERFLPPALASLAYADQDVTLGNGRVLLAPMLTAKLIQLIAPLAGERALVVACGVGYGAAVLAACGVRVIALEQDETLLAMARKALSAVSPGVHLVAGALAAGWPAEAPYDILFIEGAVQAVPPAIAAQLRQEAGRLVTVIRGISGATVGCATGGALGGTTGVGQAVRGEATQAGLQIRPDFDCATPPIPPLLPAPAFTFQ